MALKIFLSRAYTIFRKVIKDRIEHVLKSNMPKTLTKLII